MDRGFDREENLVLGSRAASRFMDDYPCISLMTARWNAQRRRADIVISIETSSNPCDVNSIPKTMPCANEVGYDANVVIR